MAVERRDLQHLDGQGHVVRMRNGAWITRVRPEGEIKPIFAKRTIDNFYVKDALVRAVLSMIEEKITIFLNAGTRLMRCSNFLISILQSSARRVICPE